MSAAPGSASRAPRALATSFGMLLDFSGLLQRILAESVLQHLRLIPASAGGMRTQVGGGALQVGLGCALLWVHRLQAVSGLSLLASELQELCAGAVQLPVPCSHRAGCHLYHSGCMTRAQTALCYLSRWELACCACMQRHIMHGDKRRRCARESLLLIAAESKGCGRWQHTCVAYRSCWRPCP